jgi:hypothetical protein
MKANKPLIVSILVAALGAVVPTMVALRMMANDNNNGELLNTVSGRWDVAYALKVSTVFYGASFLLIFAVVFALSRLWSSDAP